ncbi:hypothetical protein RSSM_02212 [Rhodopirellula sallentina SM41]|uniref:Uncharacterized protein n=1 Tax=Rhodopirellula sallentina SM41 TaxID=1263870 RepID=M5U4E9_9BACT|nr:hypothetical protein RSSM_02212 [Rhodopirellula sallentina SM41]
MHHPFFMEAMRQRSVGRHSNRPIPWYQAQPPRGSTSSVPGVASAARFARHRTGAARVAFFASLVVLQA